MIDRRELEGLDTDEIYRRGVAAALIGESDEARLFLKEVVDRDSERADAWLWLAGLSEGPRAKREMFERVLALRPDDSDARQGLVRLEEKYGPATALDEAVEVACTWHPNRVTLIRCTRCGRAMCTECAVRHPVGLRCHACVRELRSPIYVVTPTRLIAAGITAAAVSAAVGAMLPFAMMFGIFFWLVAFIAGPIAGAAIADVASRAAGRKRGRTLAMAVGAGIVIGTLAGWTVALGVATGTLDQPLVILAAGLRAAFESVIGLGLFLFMAVGAAARTLK